MSGGINKILAEIKADQSRVSEKEFKDKVLDRLEPYFEILKKEHPGQFIPTRKLVKIDVLIKPRDFTDWKNKDFVFGIEFKSPDVMTRTKNLTELVCQAMDYSYTIFDTYNSIPIIICPSLKAEITSKHGLKTYQFVARILGKRCIYELRNHKFYGLSIWHNGEHRIWSEREGVKDGKRMKLIRKIGNSNTELSNP